MTVELAYELCGRLASVWVIVGAAEGLVALGEYRDSGVYDARIAVVDGGPALVASMRSAASGAPAIAGTYVMRLAAGATLLLAPWSTGLAAGAWGTTALSALFLEWRRQYGDDGGDQMLTIMSTAFTIALLLSFARHALALGLYFMGAQACLAYVIAGVAKLRGEEWRKGIATERIFSTRTYGAPGVAALLRRRPALARAMCWGTIAFEASFVLAPFLPLPGLLALLAVAASFHVGSAAIMGLNGFLWAFVATYPAIVFLNQAVTGHLL
ncbi:MAG TPA: hypothetical protein VGY13_10225 [Solirubrobacteraceae bacterium]|jgi:hypothetical protein|nr:hypothetical protein [Solirubrobacteraceae bacterium]